MIIENNNMRCNIPELIVKQLSDVLAQKAFGKWFYFILENFAFKFHFDEIRQVDSATFVLFKTVEWVALVVPSFQVWERRELEAKLYERWYNRQCRKVSDC